MLYSAFSGEPGLLQIRTICTMSSKFQSSIAENESLRDSAADPEVCKSRAYWPCLNVICWMHLLSYLLA